MSVHGFHFSDIWQPGVSHLYGCQHADGARCVVMGTGMCRTGAGNVCVQFGDNPVMGVNSIEQYVYRSIPDPGSLILRCCLIDRFAGQKSLWIGRSIYPKDC